MHKYQSNPKAKKIIRIISIIGLILSVIAVVILYQKGILSSTTKFQNWLNQFGVFSPILFTLLQALQVIIPIIPGGVTTAVGVIAFGPWYGFLYNYIGIVVGSLVLFIMGRRWGRPIVESLVSEKVYLKYEKKLGESKVWERFFTIMILLPVAPDDALVLLSSLTTMSFKKFFWIIVLCKPWAIVAYSYALLYGGKLAQIFLLQ